MTTDPQSRYLAFGDFRLDCRSGELRKSKREIRLQPQPAKLLVLLATRRGEVVARGEIQKALWGEDTFVDFEHGINFSIKQIRDALGDDAEKPRYIETVPRVGYRFVAGAESLAPDGGEERSPYPGLSSFTSRESAFFFGREGEVESLRRKLESRRMLALIGPSGSGKSSFLRAGLLPSLPAGFRAVLFTPGSAPMRALTRALVPELSGDTEAMKDLMEDVVAAASRWRKCCERALVVIDAFEELFSLNPPEVQAAFASTIGRLAAEADVHVLLSMRDDFLFRCHDYEELAPVFSDLTPLGPLKGPALRRALEQPALSCGYRFEGEELVEEMLGEVEGERGALPLLAYAAAQLWEKRDREKKLLTREAFEENGRVVGALARHAESTLERIGPSRLPVVRELFRNLVTAQGTRASREVSELLSVFPKEDERRAAEEVLRELVAARLLTAYETSVEIIHESLLSAWPRLVRWQTQDADGALLRDQLRQAAQMWQDRGRRDDLLWTGTSYRELSLWRERYSGGLSTTEEDFAQSMAHRANRQRRRTRIAVSAVVAGLTIGLGLVGALWRKSETETLRAEASRLLALGQLQAERHPTGALAYAVKSLELADTDEARLFALQVLQAGPVGLRLQASRSDELATLNPAFSPNGEWVAFAGYRKAQLRHQDGRDPIVLPGEYPSANRAAFLGFAPNGRTLIANRWGDVRLWSVPDGRAIREAQLESGESDLIVRRNGFFTSTTVGEKMVLRFWPFEGGESRPLGSADALNHSGPYGERMNVLFHIDPEGKSMAYAIGKKIYTRSLFHWDSEPELFAELPADVGSIAYTPDGKHLAAKDDSGEIRIWSTGPSSNRRVRILGGAKRMWGLRFSPGGKWLFGRGLKNGLWVVRRWDMEAPRGSAPLDLRTDSVILNDFAPDPSDRWLVTSHVDHAYFWPLGETYARVLEVYGGRVTDIAFTPDGDTLLSASGDGTLRAWPMNPEAGAELRVLFNTPMTFPRFAIDPSGTQVVISGAGGSVLVVPLGGGPARALQGFSEEASVRVVAISPDGRRVAAGPTIAASAEKALRVWDIESGVQQAVLPIPGAGEGSDGGILALQFTDPDHILAGTEGSGKGVVLFDLLKGTATNLRDLRANSLAFSRAGHFAFAASDQLVRFTLNGDPPSPVLSHSLASRTAIDSRERFLASASDDGVVRIGPIAGGEPHVFLGHKGAIRALAFSPDGRWLASAGEDSTIRLWPVPDVTQTPPHKRSHDELLAMLRSWTNLRVVHDMNSPTRWRLEPEPFPGWAKLPHW
jgi:WD40 repeat protein/DNA-binding winged helix-turn-helix (wHTH) protein